ncbi:ribose transport, ATP-binding protein RbsA [Lachnoanaerobaculum saburreum F0468]|jgi:ribose import ATP-binding protein rbsA 2|uniref:Ribose transport, ATP-binding protein RbsA n=1 Tax=Lachnoanaerobaculum saburreum F0468 TaxID=1095750 RepID=I0R9J1_9FIRM|nr:sugar ABC transporter ATP-binding protein [Lachnoanaerobaculum saburreum]EIC96349.1 ribose transport, ATP-binding protein RbsA [Lachnoanaerobaculum saburreum F0468]
MESYLLEMKGISKSFGPVKALKKASLNLKRGEVLALMGENGAGKSTLMNVLSGSLHPDEGEILLDGVQREIKNPIQARSLGIVKIHQELQIVPELDIAENIFLGRWQTAGIGFVQKKKMHDMAKECLKMLEWEMDTRTKLKDLRIGEQQLVEIAKAISCDAKIIVMDEPTSALSEPEAKKLFHVIEKLKNKGCGIIYITHRMEEVFKISDRLSVMRDGEYIGTKEAKETDNEEIIAMMVGRSVEEQYPKRDVKIGDVILEVKNLNFTPPKESFKRSLKDISFKVRAGEVLGIAGLAGAGRSEVFESIVGKHATCTTGEILIDGKALQIRSPKDAIDAGISFATEDRKGTGLVLGRSIGDNISLPIYDHYSSFGFMRDGEQKKDWIEYMNRLHVKAKSPNAPVSSLSGGNQQKVILARWLLTKPKVLLLDEPTRGIDVGAKEEIYLLINELAASGLAVVVISSELPEVIGICDRIITICEGRLTGEISRKEATQEILLAAATNRKDVVEA